MSATKTPPADAPATATAALDELLELAARDPLILEEREDLDALVPEIPPQSFYQLARQLHDQGRLDLLFPHADPEQLTAVLDFGAWDGERLALLQLREWITAIVETYEGAAAPRGALARLIAAMDPEIWTATLLPGTAIHELDPDDDEARDQAMRAVEHLYTYETPDGFFVVAVPDDPYGRAAIRILDAVYHDDLALGRELVVSIRAAILAVIEEDLLRWRSGRLADLGFVPWEEAMKLLRPLSREQALARRADEAPRGRDDEGEPRERLALPGEAGLLRRVLDRLDPDEHGRRTREFLLLVNEVIAAQRLAPGVPEIAERALQQTRGSIELGLELLAGGRPEAIELDDFLAERCVTLGLRDVFRVGYGALDRLREAALALHRSGQISIKSVGSLLDRPWGPAIAALIQRIPELPLEGSSAKTRPITSLRDVARATQLSAQAALLARLTFETEGMGIAPVWVNRVDEPERLHLGDLVRAALILEHLPGGRGQLAPLRADDLDAAASLLLGADRRLRPELAADLLGRCRALGADEAIARPLVDLLLQRLEVELAGLERDDEGAVDLTRVGGILTIQRVSVWLRTGMTQEG
ncbi:MAG: hypothetical protein H6710_11060 [Myxococcales bacterium]|nr:hypothetical protein [Myxococcales bacterium]MCB9702454.1 hypothetical protein [Myxococcales bacterium]